MIARRDDCGRMQRIVPCKSRSAGFLFPGKINTNIGTKEAQSQSQAIVQPKQKDTLFPRGSVSPGKGEITFITVETLRYKRKGAPQMEALH